MVLGTFPDWSLVLINSEVFSKGFNSLWQIEHFLIGCWGFVGQTPSVWGVLPWVLAA